MPQLDFLTLFPQFFWCALCFIFFYFGVSYFVLPKIAAVLKYRKKKLIALANEINKKKDVSLNLLNDYDIVFFVCFKETKQLYSELLELGIVFTNIQLQELNQTKFQGLNKRFSQMSFEKDYLSDSFSK